MSRTYLIADGLTIIRNAIMAKKENADIPASKMLAAILTILAQYKYIDTFKLLEDQKQGKLRVYLKYRAGKSAIISLKHISRPGMRVYVGKDKIPHVLRGKGMAILTTPRGIVTDTQARELGVGGEVLAYVW